MLGLGDTLKRSSPVQLAGTWRFGFSAWNTSVAIKDNGSLWSWGDNTNGGLGLNDAVTRSSPVQIAGTWIRAVTSSLNTDNISGAGIKADGTLWVWGSKNYGALGLGETTDHHSSPAQIAGTWKEVSAGGRGTFGFLAIRHDGTLWTWGRNSYGEQGLGDQGISRSSPVQIGSGTWLAIVASNKSRMAFKADRSLWSWGRDSNPSLGQGDVRDRSSPTQIAGTWFHSGRDFFGAFGRALKI